LGGRNSSYLIASLRERYGSQANRADPHEEFKGLVPHFMVAIHLLVPFSSRAQDRRFTTPCRSSLQLGRFVPSWRTSSTPSMKRGDFSS
jgi:hypothetical protein